jgi:hypothetical protein
LHNNNNLLSDYRQITVLALVSLLDDYFKGTTDGPGGTNSFAVCTPVALSGSNNDNNIVNYPQRFVTTHANT